MKKSLIFTCIVSLLSCQTGCVGEAEKTQREEFPYLTSEIKQQIAKNIFFEKGPVAEDFFESANYLNAFDYLFYLAQNDSMTKLLNVLGESDEQQFFWFQLLKMRGMMIWMTVESWMYRSEMGSQFDYIMALVKAIENNAWPNMPIDKKQSLIDSVIKYEESHPFDREKMLNRFHEKIKHMTREDFMKFATNAKEREEITQSSDEKLEEFRQMIIREDALQPIADEDFQKVRKQVLDSFKARLQNDSTPAKQATEEKHNPIMAEYSIHFRAPELYPAELFLAQFMLDPQNDNIRYSFPKIFLKNSSSGGGARLEQEKPLPYGMDLTWYSIAENKCYSLHTRLPIESFRQELTAQEPKWDSLLFTLTPYGGVDLWLYSQVTGAQEHLASYQAEETAVELNDFRQSGARYETSDEPAADWAQYQQKALDYFTRANENLKKNGLPDAAYFAGHRQTLFAAANPGTAPQAGPAVPSPEEINKPDENGFTPILSAVMTQKEPEFVEKLIEAGADVNYQAPSTGETPLSAAAAMGYTAYIKPLLDAGADINHISSVSGRTALMEAVMGNHTDAAKMILEAGADVHIRSVLFGQQQNENALSIALANNLPDMVQLLRGAGAKEITPDTPPAQPRPLPNPAEVNQADAAGFTPLMHALMAQDTARVKELIGLGADVNVKVPAVGTPLLFAISSGNEEAVQALVSAGADVNVPADTTGYTPLMMAAQVGNKNMAALLVSSGADVNAKHQLNGQETGLTPLKIAQNATFEEIASLLKNAGATE